MKYFLGEKEKLAAEISISDGYMLANLMGTVTLWLYGNTFGDTEEEIYLDGYLLGGLYQMCQLKELKDKSFPFASDGETQFNYFQIRNNNLDDDQVDSYKISFGTFSDAFITWGFKSRDSIFFLWKIDLENADALPIGLKKYPKQVFKVQIGLNELIIFYEKIDRFLKDYIQHKR